MTMKTGKKGLQIIKHYEGFRAKAYYCPANVLTIGYGTTAGVTKNMVVTEAMAEKLLQADVKKFEDAINAAVKVKINQDQFDALVSFVYNVGAGNFRSSTLLKLLNQGRFDLVDDQFGRWNKGGGRVLAGLTKRRATEATLFKTGKVAL